MVSHFPFGDKDLKKFKMSKVLFFGERQSSITNGINQDQKLIGSQAGVLPWLPFAALKIFIVPNNPMYSLFFPLKFDSEKNQ